MEETVKTFKEIIAKEENAEQLEMVPLGLLNLHYKFKVQHKIQKKMETEGVLNV